MNVAIAIYLFGLALGLAAIFHWEKDNLERYRMLDLAFFWPVVVGFALVMAALIMSGLLDKWILPDSGEG